MANSDRHQRFNLDTMSGVFPGTRTMVFQRVQLWPANQPAAAAQWARLSWYDEPSACVVELEASKRSPATQQTLNRDLTPSTNESPALVRLPHPLNDDFRQRLATSLGEVGWCLHVCGTCGHWQPAAAANPDGLPAGNCTWRPATGASPPLPPVLAAQSTLSLACTYWLAIAPLHAQEEPAPAPTGAIAPMRKAAEQDSNERWTWWGQLRRLLFRRHADKAPRAAPSWEEKVVERSGVGAGTEQCFACQGRIANLGALTVATPEGDKRTFSVWRCRTCYTCYLNDWIDRWERTDNLETEESYYRIAPAEALEVLAVIDDVVHAEHPAGRHERDLQRGWMVSLVADRQPLSHQVRQGR